MEKPIIKTAWIKTKNGEVEVPAWLDNDGSLNVQLESIPKEDLL